MYFAPLMLKFLCILLLESQTDSLARLYLQRPLLCVHQIHYQMGRQMGWTNQSPNSRSIRSRHWVWNVWKKVAGSRCHHCRFDRIPPFLPAHRDRLSCLILRYRNVPCKLNIGGESRQSQSPWCFGICRPRQTAQPTCLLAFHGR